MVVSYAAVLRILSKHAECKSQLTEEEDDKHRELERASGKI